MNVLVFFKLIMIFGFQALGLFELGKDLSVAILTVVVCPDLVRFSATLIAIEVASPSACNSIVSNLFKKIFDK